jgi:hypothetical protein
MIKRVKAISNKIIHNSFPLLIEKRICYFLIYLRFYAFSAWIPPFARLIAVSTRTKGLNDFVLTGILAHELCHQERYIQMGFKKYLRFIIKYLFSKESRISEERATDILTIEKGYGRELYELTIISSQDKNHRNIIDNYLNAGEIRSYAESIGKWQAIAI